MIRCWYDFCRWHRAEGPTQIERGRRRVTRANFRASLIVAVGLLSAGLLLASTPAHAITFDLTSDHCTGGCGIPPFGTVMVAQNGASVDVTVDLAAGYSFVKTGSADF